MTSIRVASWNTEGRLTDWGYKTRGTPLRIAKEIVALDADVIYSPEAFNVGHLDHEAATYIESHGYKRFAIPNNDRVAGTDPAYQPVQLFYSRIQCDYKIVRLGNIRDCGVLYCKDGERTTLRVVGVHLHDKAEALRQIMLDDLLPLLKNEHLPTVVVGDWNAMYHHARLAAFCRSKILRAAGRLLPNAHLRGVVVRVGEMADGGTMKRFCDETGYNDADPHGLPTETPKMRQAEWLPSMPLVQIDHILASPDILIKRFTVAKDGGSDHRAISATIRI